MLISMNYLFFFFTKFPFAAILGHRLCFTGVKDVRFCQIILKIKKIKYNTRITKFLNANSKHCWVVTFSWVVYLKV